MTMPDGNTAALRQHMAEQDKAESVYETWSKRVIEDLVSDVIDGVGISLAKNKYLTVADFIDDYGDRPGLDCFITSSEVAVLICGSIDACFDVELRLVRELEERVRAWCETTRGQELVTERCWELDREAKEEA